MPDESSGSAARRRLITVLFIATLALAVFLRVAWPGVTEFKFDEAITLRRAMDFVREGVWPRGTPSSVAGVPQPPLKAYLLAIPLAIVPRPSAAVVFLGLLGAASVGLTFLFGRRYFNARVGAIAALLLASAPWAIFFDRKLWAQNVSIFTLLFAFSLFGLIVDRRSRWLAGLLAAIGILVMLYIGGVVFVPMAAIALALHYRAVREAVAGDGRGRPALWLLIGLALLAAALATYLAPYLPDLLALLRGGLPQGSGSGGGGPAIGRRLMLAAQAATGYHFHSLLGGQWRALYVTLPELDGAIDGTLLALTLAGMAYVAVAAVVRAIARDPERPAAPYTLLALWIAVPVAVWSVTGFEPQIHRYLQLYPAQQLCLALLLVDGADWLAAHASTWRPDVRWGSVIGVVGAFALAVVTLWHVAIYVTTVRYVAQTPLESGHGAPAAITWQAADRARELASAGRLPIVVYTSGGDPEHEGGAARWDALLGDLDPIVVDQGRAEVIPPVGQYVRVDESVEGREIAVEAAPGAPASVTDPAGLARFANGVDLLAVEATGAGSARLVWRVWSVPADLPSIVFYTARLVDADGGVLGQVDGPLPQTAFWTPGMRIVTPVEFPAGTAGQRIVAGLYVLGPDGAPRGVDVLDVAGNPAGQEAIVPLDAAP